MISMGLEDNVIAAALGVEEAYIDEAQTDYNKNSDA